MGSRNGDPRQLNGIGGATSTTSKVAIVSPSQTPGIDVEYTFAQVAVGKQKVDYSGNCGNIASGVGPFAVEEGIVKAKPGQNSIDVRILNTNTGRVLVETVAVDEDGLLLEQGNYQMAGVSDPGAEIKVAFVDPAGSMTGMLFPTGRTEDTITVEDPTALERPFSVQATLIDAANPFVIVDAQTLPSAFLQGSEEWLETIEDIRREGAVMMGLANSVEEAALTRGTPKIMMVSSPNTLNGYGKVDSTPDISVLSMSMGQIHPSVQLTGAVCLAGASCIEGTVAHRHCRSAELLDAFGVQPIKHGFQSPKTIMIGHRSGQIPVGVHLQDQGALERCIVSRTARRLFEGNVLFYA
ncbi:hypothetical protein B0A52_00513 [Exophiala mesophila]|uniref:Methylitaconate delta2-delta3-isomerase n=1 Tax=Exophiala mesophila TaxID=212818 RepID=A0A438NHG4_EXOME|nr:hypothetical protein B0A52_00513 [Exophiala mesophila]